LWLFFYPTDFTDLHRFKFWRRKYLCNL